MPPNPDASPFAYFSSPQDWMIIALLAVVLFGGKKIPELARGIGEGIREFKKSVRGGDDVSPVGSDATTANTVLDSTLPSGEGEISTATASSGNASR